jgi:hypothetical protein
MSVMQDHSQVGRELLLTRWSAHVMGSAQCASRPDTEEGGIGDGAFLAEMRGFSAPLRGV